MQKISGSNFENIDLLIIIFAARGLPIINWLDLKKRKFCSLTSFISSQGIRSGSWKQFEKDD